MELIWHYLVNQFINATTGNYKKALKLSNYHDAYLKKMMTDNPGDPDWATLYNRYHPFHVTYTGIYTEWKNAGGTQEGQTLTLDQLLLLLITKINKWDSQVQAVNGFEKGTGAYKTIFPNGHKPFVKGGITARVNAVKVLGEALIPYGALAAVKTEVDTFYTTLDDTRDTQEGAKGGTKQKSTEVENKRIVVMTEQFRDLGFLINKGAETPTYIIPFFDLNILQDHIQVFFTGTLDPAENEAVLKHTFVSDDEIEVEITTPASIPPGTQVQLYLASTPNGTDSTPVNFTAKAAKTKIQVSAFGISNYGLHRHLTAVNSTAYELHYQIELL